MATMVALQSSMASLSISSNSFLGQRLSPPLLSTPVSSLPLCPCFLKCLAKLCILINIKLVDQPCTVVMRVSSSVLLHVLY
ncbi:hypothetical protein BHM03_00049889 [Ensete ventricosum]|nr:hypothetical protein BHM03_00049889 [Ensete ventricosum]